MIRLGTRGSALALAQAGWVVSRLPGAELVPITTSGDRRRAVDDKREWVLELEEALERARSDIARMRERAAELERRMSEEIERVRRSFKRELVRYEAPGSALVPAGKAKSAKRFRIPVERPSR